MGLKEKLRATVAGRTPRRLRSEVALTAAEAEAVRRREHRGAHPSEPEDGDPRGNTTVRRAMHAATVDPPVDATLEPVTAPEETAAFARASGGDMESFVTGGGEAIADRVRGADDPTATDAVTMDLVGDGSGDWLEVDLL